MVRVVRTYLFTHRASEHLSVSTFFSISKYPNQCYLSITINVESHKENISSKRFRYFIILYICLYICFFHKVLFQDRINRIYERIPIYIWNEKKRIRATVLFHSLKHIYVFIMHVICFSGYVFVLGKKVLFACF